MSILSLSEAGGLSHLLRLLVPGENAEVAPRAAPPAPARLTQLFAIWPQMSL